ncbi:MAG: hypothetical protein ABSG98_08915 [Anaerolineales bacterium]|jgi:hypothetical protein
MSDARRVRHASLRRLEKQATLQIYLPIAGGFLLTLAAFLWVALRSHATLASISNLSIALLTLPLLLFGLLGLVGVFVLLVAVSWLLGNLPYYGGMIQEWVERGAAIIRRVADLAAAPLVLAKTAAEFVRGPLRVLERHFHFRKDD